MTLKRQWTQSFDKNLSFEYVLLQIAYHQSWFQLELLDEIAKFAKFVGRNHKFSIFSCLAGEVPERVLETSKFLKFVQLRFGFAYTIRIVFDRLEQFQLFICLDQNFVNSIIIESSFLRWFNGERTKKNKERSNDEPHRESFDLNKKSEADWRYRGAGCYLNTFFDLSKNIFKLL